MFLLQNVSATLVFSLPMRYSFLGQSVLGKVYNRCVVNLKGDRQRRVICG